MTAPVPDAIRVTPAALGDGAGLARGAASAIRSCVDGLPGTFAASVVGDTACADSLLRTARLIEQAVRTGADGVDQLARTLDSARGTYGLADALAVPASPSAPR